MAKRYVLEISNELILYELEGRKKKKNALFIYPKRLYEKEFYHYYLSFFSSPVNFENKEDFFEKVIILNEQCRIWRENNFLLKSNKLYLNEKCITAEVLKKNISSFHRANNRGSYHVILDNHYLIKRGQLTAPNNLVIQNSNKDNMQVFRKNEWKRLKGEFQLYFSESEVEKLIWILVYARIHGIKLMPQWVREIYGERVDYFSSFLSKELEKFAFLEYVVSNERDI